MSTISGVRRGYLLQLLRLSSSFLSRRLSSFAIRTKYLSFRRRDALSKMAVWISRARPSTYPRPPRPIPSPNVDKTARARVPAVRVRSFLCPAKNEEKEKKSSEKRVGALIGACSAMRGFRTLDLNLEIRQVSQ